MDCGNCGDPDATASLFGLILCPRCYRLMEEHSREDDWQDGGTS